ncbi:class I SAM-dependent RNA methyltransferase [Nitrogeniibacter mangrovi]|uniref:Class I SAM-dependent RNA methyltransferase n=1 Tax=Nitrogeniibacter mangrovi TaxID=2016596 RepID=A0A6C1B3V9_9RHOO|nr:THUMP domain-containing protein [Nitrogeniibacter mangrovi]QID16884.1 class I SAM-dependent RNA methyltransferase [Nitrogeniibacter mangrovi]
MNERFFAPCPRGLEAGLVDELGALGARDLHQTHGGVAFRGDWALACRANLESRLATRVLWQVAFGRYRREEDIYRLAYSVTWAKWFTHEQTMRVNVTARRSPLKSLEFITLRIKDAVCDHFRMVHGSRPSIDTANPDVRIHAFLNQDQVTLYLDTSGEPLYKRGFKQAAVEAPLKENLAAGILRIAGWRTDEPLLDPMCGSGTFLIEAAQMALDIAPGLGRGFAFEHLRHVDEAMWRKLRREAEGRRRHAATLPIFGSDSEAVQVKRARINLEAAGLAEQVRLEQVGLLERTPPTAQGVMVANPPYGVRIGESAELEAFYPQLGDALKARWSGWRCYFLSADAALPKLIGLRASKRTPLYNGALECRVYEYKMIAGSLRKPKDA